MIGTARASEGKRKNEKVSQLLVANIVQIRPGDLRKEEKEKNEEEREKEKANDQRSASRGNPTQVVAHGSWFCLLHRACQWDDGNHLRPRTDDLRETSQRNQTCRSMSARTSWEVGKANSETAIGASQFTRNDLLNETFQRL